MHTNPIANAKICKPILMTFTCLAVLGLGLVNAAGPGRIARMDRNLWPYPISDSASFDFASRMEILVFVQSLMEAEPKLHGPTLTTFLGLSKADSNGVANWKNRVLTTMVANFNLAKYANPSPFWNIKNRPKISDENEIKRIAAQADSIMPANLKPWQNEAKKFYADYIYEQLRLAALFSKVSSEIFTYSSKEILGDQFQDKAFLLTFDDGPTLPGGGTDTLIAWLKQNHLNGTFFMLGDNLQHRLAKQGAAKLQNLYSGMCTASHGREHKSHAKWDQWQSSIISTQALLDSVFPGNKKYPRFFRPPYGQRTSDAQFFMDSIETKLMLWNLDSQDWNTKITAVQAADRITTLILLWRHGIILFHDVHNRAISALPILTQTFTGSGIRWKSCLE